MQTIGPGDHGSTFGGHPVACAAALATIEILDREGLAARSARLGSEAGAAFSAGLEGTPAIVDVRGLGLMIGIEMASPELAEVVQRAAHEAGLLVLRSGSQKEVVRLLPPLVIERDELMSAVRTLCDVIRGLGRAHASQPGNGGDPAVVARKQPVGAL